MGSWRLLFAFILAVWGTNLSAQTTSESSLKKLDELAFSAMEKNAPNALILADSFLNESLRTKPTFFRVNAYTLLGILYKNKGYYVTSLDYYLKALNAAEQIKDVPRRSACLNNIGSVYQLQGNYTRAISYFNESLELEKKLSQPLQQSIRYYNLGECFKDIDSLDLALTYFNNSLLIEQRSKNQAGIVYAQLGIADVYIRIKRFTDAEIALSGIEKVIPGESMEERIIFHKLRGKLALAQGNDEEGLSHIQKAEGLSASSEIRTHLLEILKIQIAFYENAGNWDKASAKYRQYVKLSDEMNSAQIKNQLDDLTYRNELTKKQLEIELVQEERDRARKNEKLEKDLRVFGQKITWFVLILLIAALSLVVLGFRKLTNRK